MTRRAWKPKLKQRSGARSAAWLRLRLLGCSAARGSGPRLAAVQEPKRFRALRWQHPRRTKTRTVRAGDVCVCVCVCRNCVLVVCVRVCEVLKIDCTLKTHKTQNEMSKGNEKRVCMSTRVCVREQRNQSAQRKAKWNVKFVPQIRMQRQFLYNQAIKMTERSTVWLNVSRCVCVCASMYVYVPV